VAAVIAADSAPHARFDCPIAHSSVIRCRAGRAGWGDGTKPKEIAWYETEIAIDEIVDLIASTRVAGTTIHDEEGRRWHLQAFMIDKLTGQVDMSCSRSVGCSGSARIISVALGSAQLTERMAASSLDVEKEIFEVAPRFPGDADLLRSGLWRRDYVITASPKSRCLNA